MLNRSDIRKKGEKIYIKIDEPLLIQSKDINSLTNEGIKMVNEKLSSKPTLITKNELDSLGNDINLVGYNQLDEIVSNSDKSFSNRLLNWVEPYVIKGYTKTLFYTEVNSELKIGDKVFIISGNYDSDTYLKKNKYKKGKDGYKILFIDKCKVVLDIDYTGVNPFKTNSCDDFIRVYYIKDNNSFLQINREITTRDNSIKNKFHNNNTIAYIDNNYTSLTDWGINGGISGTPGFFVRNSSRNWINITSNVLNNTIPKHPTYYNNNRIKIMNDSFIHSGVLFKKGFVYKYVNNKWIIDDEYNIPIITKSNFRNGNFEGEWNSGLYGHYKFPITWHGDNSVWNTGVMVNTDWVKGDINSKHSTLNSYFSSFDENGLPHQKVNLPNNNNRGYNFFYDSNLNKSIIENGSFYNISFNNNYATYSVVENEVLNINSNFSNKINKSFLYDCTINNSYLLNDVEISKSRLNNSKIENSKSINSYFNNSVFKRSNFNSDSIIKILDYDELSASEYFGSLSATFSYKLDHKVFKFYISEDSYKRLSIGSTFYLKDIKINNKLNDVIDFFDRRYIICSWTEYTEEDFKSSILGKRGYNYSAFISTPKENSYLYESQGNSSTYITKTTNPNNKNLYSIDIWVSRYDISNVLGDDLNVFNSDNIIDISKAYVIDSDFRSGLFIESNWNSGHHIESNKDNIINLKTTTDGHYDIHISNGHLIVDTSYTLLNNETKPLNIGDIIFLDSINLIDNGDIYNLPDTYKIINISGSELELEEVGTYIIPTLPLTGIFKTDKAENRYGHLKLTNFKNSNIKSGLFKRSYFNNSKIKNDGYDISDINFGNISNIKKLVISDSIFSNNNNKLEEALYINSFFVNGNDEFNGGIIYDSIWNNLNFNSGLFKNSRWINGKFLDGIFYDSRSFNSNSSNIILDHTYENVDSYYRYITYDVTNTTNIGMKNNRKSWINGEFVNGKFIKSDWENGIFSNGEFYNSKWYNGTFNNGKIGDTKLSSSDTIFYNGTINYAIVNNADLISSDTSFNKNVSKNINWNDGVFNNGNFGTNENQVAINKSTWYKGKFNNGNFISNARWIDGTFNNGKFLTHYGWTHSNSSNKSDYSWEYGEFNGGDFGNGSGQSNSTWYNGEFNGGTFKGRVWNNGLFSYGDFEGSGLTAVGGLKCSNADEFTDSFTSSYWGKWRNGVVSRIKDKFLTDVEVHTKTVKAKELEKIIIDKRRAVFKNALWENGTFSHYNGDFINSVWLDGTFDRGNFNKSSFNPYVKRNGASQSFNLNDSCHWRHGILDDSEFYISKWSNGDFMYGTATGMIWENGIAHYMNAYNVFWEDGLWKNGNWHGSYFTFSGIVDDNYYLQIYRRGFEWSGEQNIHIWNVFEDPYKNENILDKDADTVKYSGTGWVAPGGLIPVSPGGTTPVTPGGGLTG
jgi:hypothetical protein